MPILTAFIRRVSSRYVLPLPYFDPEMRHWYLNKEQSSNKVNHLNNIIMYFFWICLAVSLSGPQYPKIINNEISTQGDSVIVILDMSASMNARDEKPTRLLRAKSEMILLVDKLKSGDKLGVMLFSGTTHLLFPPTNDKQAMKFYINSIKRDILPVAGSVYYKAIKEASLLLQATDNKNSILLISDGDSEKEVDTLAKIKSLNLSSPVYTLAIGKQKNTPIPSINSKDDQHWLQSSKGATVTSNRNDIFLQKISQMTNARFHILSDTDSDIDFLYTNGIKSNTYSDKDIENTNWVQLYHPFLFLAILLFFYTRVLQEYN